MHKNDHVGAKCISHGKFCNRPSVEKFTANEQAGFEAFCGALLRVLSGPSPEVKVMKFPNQVDNMGLD